MDRYCRSDARSGTVEVRTGRQTPQDAAEQQTRARSAISKREQEKRSGKANKEDGDMSQENTITLRGFVTAEPRFWQPTPKHTPVTEIRVGSTPRRLNRATGEWEDGDTSYFTVKCWRRLAVNVKGSLRKGDMVIVRGKFVTKSWVDDQQRTRVQMQVEADSVGHDLSFGWSHFNRGAQAGWNSTREQGGNGASGRRFDANADAQHDPDEPDESSGPDISPAFGMLDPGMPDPGMSAPEMQDSGMSNPGMPGPGMSDSGMPHLGMPGSEAFGSGVFESGVADSGVADREVFDSGASDVDFEKLALGLDAQAEVAGAF
jgi:single-strand DNA-binding protein